MGKWDMYFWVFDPLNKTKIWWQDCWVSYSGYFETGKARIQKHLQVTDSLWICSLLCLWHK